MIQLVSGVYFDPMKPDPSVITVADIAHALALQCRYAGHCFYHYSVAQHCCYVYDVIRREYPQRFDLQAWALLHDADEGLGLPDLPTLVKQHPAMVGYREAQAGIMRAVVERFGLNPATCPPEVDVADKRMLATEWRALKHPSFICPHPMDPYPDFEIASWGIEEAQAGFERRWYQL